MTGLVVGLGSMGRRRIRLIKQHFSDITLFGVDQNEVRCQAVSGEYEIETYASITDALAERIYDYAFICTSPLSHAELISNCLTSNIHVFTELNLVSEKYSQNIELAVKNGLVLFLASTFLYRGEIKHIIKRVKESKSRLSYTYHVGQYLPDWHPWENYTEYFINDKRTNGCREIYAIELPWLVSAFGKIVSFSVQKANISGLKLTYPDSYSVIFKHESGHIGQLLVDVVSRIPVRHFEVFGESLQMEWRGSPEKLWEADEELNTMQQIILPDAVNRENGYADFIVEDAYLEELKTFFSLCAGNKQEVYGFENDLYVLDLINKIEK